MEYSTIINMYNRFQESKNGVPEDLTKWKQINPKIDFSKVDPAKLRTMTEFMQQDSPIITEIIEEDKTSQSSNKEISDAQTAVSQRYKTTAGAVAEFNPRTTAHTYQISSETSATEPNYSLVVLRSVVKKLGLLLVPGLLLFILINDAHISIVKKLITFGVFFVYAVFLVARDCVASLGA